MAVTKAATKARTNRGRADQNRAVRMEALRDELKGKEYLRQIDGINKEYDSMSKSVKGAKTEKALTKVLQKVDPRLKILKQKQDLNFRRLNKILPDVKDVILSDPEGNNPLKGFAETMAQATKDASK